MVNMVLTVIALDPHEQFLRFLDYDLINITETHETSGLRTIKVEYTFQNLQEDKALFKLGNKIWIQGDDNLTDTLYVINTKVSEDVYKENVISFTAEEVLVELNYAPLFSHTEFSATNFHKIITNNKLEVYVDYNALEYWFGDYFNIGIIQEPMNKYARKISVTGTMTRMALLRAIEEQTGNVFITRYEKDVLDNTIHRYLDFLNPLNVDRDWELHLTYKFLDHQTVNVIDKDGNVTAEDKPWEVTRFVDDTLEPESIPESVYPTPDVDNDGTEVGSTYDAEDDEQDPPKPQIPLENVNPANCVFRITSDGDVIYTWSAADVDFENSNQECAITLSRQKTILGLDCNNKSFATITGNDTVKPVGYLAAVKAYNYDDGHYDDSHMTIADDNKRDYNIPDDSQFEIYDSAHDKVVFQTTLNTEIGHVHFDVLDFGFNIDNVQFDVDETDTYTAVSPLLSFDENNSNGMSKANFNNLISRWQNLSISKGQEIHL